MAEEKHIYMVMAFDDQSCGRAAGDPRGGSVKRIGCYAEHKAYQGATADPENTAYIQKLSAGPITEEDGTYMVGSGFVLVGTREEVDNFLSNDPFSKNGVWERVEVSRYIPVGGVKPHAQL